VFVVTEGGRLSRELSYTLKWLGEGSGTTYELVIQTGRDVARRVSAGSDLPPRGTRRRHSKSSGSNVLNVASMLQHLETVRSATSLSVELFDVYASVLLL